MEDPFKNTHIFWSSMKNLISILAVIWVAQHTGQDGYLVMMNIGYIFLGFNTLVLIGCGIWELSTEYRRKKNGV